MDKCDGVKHIPGRHFTGVIHAGIGQPVCAHAVKLPHDAVEQDLGLFLFVDKIVEESEIMIRLISLAILAMNPDKL